MSKKAKTSKKIAFILSDKGLTYMWNKVKVPIKVFLIGLNCLDSIVYGIKNVPYRVMFYGTAEMHEEYLVKNKHLFSLITQANIGIILASVALFCVMVLMLLNKNITKKKKNFFINILLIVQCIVWCVLSILNNRGVIL